LTPLSIMPLHHAMMVYRGCGSNGQHTTLRIIHWRMVSFRLWLFYSKPQSLPPYSSYIMIPLMLC